VTRVGGQSRRDKDRRRLYIAATLNLGGDARPQQERSMSSGLKLFAVVFMAATALSIAGADARPIKWARSGDALTLDPHAQNEGPTANVNRQMYEPLVERDRSGKLLPTLAVSWKITDDPTVWEFKLRQGVKFHNGSAFDADDVVFSLDRARQPTSDYKGYLTSVEKVTKVDAHTVHIKTKGPNPILVENLTNLYMMDKEWAETNNAQKVQDFKNKEENFAVRNANGTGPFALVSREPDVKTVFKRNEGYWGRGEFPVEITELTLTPIKADATRVAALLSGEVDFVQDVPVQDVERLKSAPKVTVTVGPENRTIFLGMDVGSKELRSSDVKGKNPFADQRVRQAMNMTVNREAIQRVVMRTQSVPAGAIVPPFVNGYTKELDTAPKPDNAKAKALLAAAGYPNGFSVSFHCPNDRYLNDEAICQAAVGMLGQIGIKANLVSQSKSLHFPLIQKAEIDFYLLGWGVPTYDSEYILSFLYHTRTDKYGSWNATRYSNPEADKLIEALSSETDLTKRNAAIAKLWQLLGPEALYLAIHHQVLAHAMKSDLDIPVHPDNQTFFKMVAFRKS
jgi:peptide/nickel transport system substrate-binding protein